MPRVSVIIPTYNRANYLGEAVASALAQTYRDFEVIVIDDGSTDNTAEIARQLPPEVRFFRQENKGVSAARNKGIELARGEYLCFLDSDDILLPDALQKNVSFLDQHPEVAFCYGQVYKIDESGRQMRLGKLRGARKTCVRDGKEQIMRLLFRGDIAILAALARRSCVKETGVFDTTLRVGEDIDFWLRLASKSPVGYLAEPVGKVRVHPENATNMSSFKTLEQSQIGFVERALQSAGTTPGSERLRRKSYFSLYCYLSEEAARKGYPGMGFHYLLKALKAYPQMLFHAEGISFLASVGKSFLPESFRGLGKRALMTIGLR